jgi:hypothetical protein
MVEENKLTIEERVENIEKIIRENFNNLGSMSVKVLSKPDDNSVNGGYISLYCGKCNKALISIYDIKSPDFNFCSQCGTKIELDETFNKAVEEVKHAKEIYKKVHPLQEQITELTKRIGKTK